MSNYACDTCGGTPVTVLNVQEDIFGGMWTSRAVGACAEHETQIRKALAEGGNTIMGETSYAIILKRTKGSRLEVA